MITLYDKTFSTLYGTLNTVTEALVEEERNGLFELSFTILNTDSLFKYIEKENIVVCNANDTLLNQKFRIYNTRKLMNNRVGVYARHISFDLMYDFIDNVSFENQSCEYALNELFRNSNFSQHYQGYSDIVNAQNYSISNVNVLAAIGGTEGSILDTFGTGAEILRDNENIHVLNKRGHDNSVTIEYRKNLTGFELEEDTTDLVTRILPYARYTPEGEEEVTIKANYVDSPLINNYSHPFIKSIDYTDKFENDEVPTIEKLVQFAEKEYTVNKVDIAKQNYKIEFIPLSECVGYEGLNDRISLCDTVTIIDTRYNVNTQAKVIKTIFNVLKNRYESIELGEPKTSLGDIISSSTDDKVTEEQVKDIVASTPSTNYPNTLPKVPVLESFVYGFANIELRWTFENKVYYAYEVYASKTKDFTPNSFDLIYQGQASSYMFQAQPNETWYFKVCGINSYNKRTQFSNEVEVVTTKIDDLSNYVSEMAIGEALIGTLNLGRGWVGQLNANLLDVKGNFSVTDGNGRRTFDIDSYGNVNLQATTLKMIVDGTVDNVATSTQVQQKVDSVELKFSQSGGTNLLKNSAFKNGQANWSHNRWDNSAGGNSYNEVVYPEYNEWTPANRNSLAACIYGLQEINSGAFLRCGFDSHYFNVKPNTTYSLNCLMAAHRIKSYTIEMLCFDSSGNRLTDNNHSVVIYDVKGGGQDRNNWNKIKHTWTTQSNAATCMLRAYMNEWTGQLNSAFLWICEPIITEGDVEILWTPNADELYTGITTIDKDGITVTSSNVNSKTNMSANGFKIIKTDNGQEVFKVNSDGTLGLIGEMTCYSGIAKSGYLGNNILKFYNWPNNTSDEIAWVYSGLQQSSGLKTLDLIGLNMVNIGTQGPGVAGASGIQVISTEVDIFKDMDFNNRKIKNLDSINEGAESSDLWINKIYLRTNQVNSAMDSGYLNLNYWRGGSATTSIVRVANGVNTGDYGELRCGDFKAYGTKNACVETSVGYVGINAYETAEYYFGDIGESILDSEGYSYVYIDSVFKETISNAHKYQVFLTVYGEGTANVIKREPNYFIIKGTPEIEVGYEIKGKRKGYEDYRLERDYNSFVKGQEHGLDIDFLAEREKFDKELEQAALNFSLTNENLEMVVSQSVEMYINNEELIKRIEEGVILNESIN